MMSPEREGPSCAERVVIVGMENRQVLGPPYPGIFCCLALATDHPLSRLLREDSQYWGKTPRRQKK
ncbi:hypothetical protein IF1G_01396 [Cordyceps javanica]|uniref:Uncharacterized protein n=1 Tax=Cordyceps javanica TaxID=43265 RepID=A0A545VBR6_9HYPO|nr:hypothetical protein IF1G_01396 [Cordyceps javanica]